MFDVLKDSDFMEGVMIELLEFYRENTDAENRLEFDDTMLDDLLEKSIELEWYEVSARLHKHIQNVTKIK